VSDRSAVERSAADLADSAAVVEDLGEVEDSGASAAAAAAAAARREAGKK
jgi:hypothetical protein